MRFLLCPLLLVCAGLACAQTSAPPVPQSATALAEDPEITRAKAGLEKLRQLVESGVLPRIQLDKAETALSDAQDRAFLRKTLYGDLSESQSEEMISAAKRLLDHRTAELESARKLVEEGVASQASLGTFMDEVDRANKEYNLANQRSNFVQELAHMARAEQMLETQQQEAPVEARKSAERFDGSGLFNPREFEKIETAFHKKFEKTLPVSAMGETATHRAMGFDHRGRVDVAVNPDQPEGVWLRHYLTEHEIPFFAFRQAVPGKATGAHIHIGPGSTRITRGG